MEIIDKRKSKRERDKEIIKAAIEEEPQAPGIKIVADWRMSAQYNKAMENKVMFTGMEQNAREEFLKRAIEHRNSLKNIIIEEYDEGKATLRNTIEIDSDDETISALEKEANKLGLGYDEYIRGIFYTAAFNINEQKREAEEKYKAKMIEHRLFYLDDKRYINQTLRKKLEEKCGKSEYVMGTAVYAYSDMLIDLAEEYFGLEKSKHHD